MRTYSSVLFQRNKLLLPAVRLKLLKQALGPLNLTGDRFRSLWRWLYKSQKEQPISRRFSQQEQIPVRSASLNQGGFRPHTHSFTHTSMYTLKMCQCMISSSLYFCPVKKRVWTTCAGVILMMCVVSGTFYKNDLSYFWFALCGLASHYRFPW